jgi:hypothetical protein
MKNSLNFMSTCLKVVDTRRALQTYGNEFLDLAINRFALPNHAAFVR